jgi:hypothetical protein
LEKKKKISGFVFWGSWGVLYPKMVEKFEKKFLGTWWVKTFPTSLPALLARITPWN